MKAEVLKAVAGPAVTELMTFHETNVRIYANVALVKAGKELRNRVFCESLANLILESIEQFDIQT
jgi:hypothetical protein